MFGLIAAAVAVDDERRGAFDEGTAEGIDARYHQGNCLHDSRAAAFPQFRAYVGRVLRQHFDCLVGIVAARIIHANRHPPSVIHMHTAEWHYKSYFVTSPCGVESEAGLRCVPVRNIHASLATQIGPTSK